MDDLETEIRKLIVQSVEAGRHHLAGCGRRRTVFGEGLGLDSIDALELGVAIRQRYGIKDRRG